MANNADADLADQKMMENEEDKHDNQSTETKPQAMQSPVIKDENDGQSPKKPDAPSAGITEHKDSPSTSVAAQSGLPTGQSDASLYSYTERDFTTEIFKIEITNLPKHVGMKELKKRITNLGLKPGKMKITRDMKVAFVNFKCEEDKQEALKVMNGHTWKGREWKVKAAKPAADPYLKKRKLENEESGQDKRQKSEDLNLPPAERLQRAVTPLAHLSYSEQLEVKAKELNESLQKIYKQMLQSDGQIRLEVKDKPPPVLKSPAENFYRNKAEFTIGRSPEGEEKVVGFRLGSYKEGSVHVVSPTECSHIPQLMKNVASEFQKYFQTVSTYPAFDPVTRDGNWKQLMLRTTQTDQCMVVPQFHPQSLTQEEIKEEKKKMKEYFENGEGKNCTLTSLYFQVQRDRGQPISMDLLLGKKCIVETLLDLKFRVSPASFFQVNTLAAELLYTKIGEFCGISENTILLDVCCGTGSIGLTLAKKVKKVFGIEMIQDAIDDAKENAKLNDIENVEFLCGKAEDVIDSLLQKITKENDNPDIVAVVDPPRAGLHPRVIRALRDKVCQADKNISIPRIIYVSCNPAGAALNLIDLTRLPSNRVKGEPFTLVDAVAVDMFPSTTHVEALFKLERSLPQT